MKKFLFLVFVLFQSLGLTAQLSMDADISPRGEIRHGYMRLPSTNDKVAAHINQRTRLGIGWKGENLRTRIAIQNVRIWGQDPQKQFYPAIDIHEAWAELLFNTSYSLKIGRQELRYDNQRFIGNTDWGPAGQKHDIALLKYEQGADKLHFGNGFNQDAGAYERLSGTAYNVNNYKYISYVWYNRALGSNSNVSLLGLADGYQGLMNNALYVRGTWSAYYTFNNGRYNFMVNPALQHGKTNNGTSISALYLRSEVGVKPIEKLQTTLGIEILSGDNAESDSYNSFNPTHGTGHAFGGYMDYFTNYPSHTRNNGLVNPFLRNKYAMNERTSLEADLHLFYLQQYINADNHFLGTEVDLGINYRFNDFTQVIGGYSHMFGTDVMEFTKGGGDKNEPAYFIYLMLRIRPKLL